MSNLDIEYMNKEVDLEPAIRVFQAAWAKAQYTDEERTAIAKAVVILRSVARPARPRGAGRKPVPRSGKPRGMGERK